MRAIGLTLLLMLLLSAGLEWVARRYLIPSSRILGRTEREWSAAHTDLRAASAPQGRKRLLVAGNSLLDEDVDFDAFRAGLSPSGWDAHRLVMEQTTYLDWKYGLRRLLADGARPDAVVLLLLPSHIMSNDILGGAFANHMLDTRDWMEMMADTKLHPTEGTGLLLARYSKFYGLREDLRKNLIRKILPGWTELTPLLIPVRPGQARAPDYDKVAGERMVAIRDQLASRGIPFLLVIPPLSGGAKWEDPAAAAVERKGVPVALPVRSGELPASAYRDGFHMTPEAAKGYTEKLVPAVASWLAAARPR